MVTSIVLKLPNVATMPKFFETMKSLWRTPIPKGSRKRIFKLFYVGMIPHFGEADKMDADFIVSYDTMYDNRSYRADWEQVTDSDDSEEELNEYGQPLIVLPWEMEV